MARNIKREKIKHNIQNEDEQEIFQLQKRKFNQKINFIQIVIQAIIDSFVPRLVADNFLLLNSLLNDVLPNATCNRPSITRLQEEIENVAKEMYLDSDQLWIEKVLQLDCHPNEVQEDKGADCTSPKISENDPIRHLLFLNHTLAQRKS